jgi:hypothetical protein
MKSADNNKIRFQVIDEKEYFFQMLENDSVFFKEAIEAMLTLAISDPKLTNQVANLIESDYRDLYLAIQKEGVQSQKNDLPGCCQTSKNK